jgi:hypothetical protein
VTGWTFVDDDDDDDDDNNENEVTLFVFADMANTTKILLPL